MWESDNIGMKTLTPESNAKPEVSGASSDLKTTDYAATVRVFLLARTTSYTTPAFVEDMLPE